MAWSLKLWSELRTARKEQKNMLSFCVAAENCVAEHKESSDKALSELDILMLF